MNKHYYLIVDTETTQKNTVADFGAVITDRSGAIIEQFGVLLDGHFGSIDLFADYRAPADSLWSTQAAHRREKDYRKMVKRGSRSIASPAHVQLWLARILGQYNPIVTAYNLSFDFGKCANTGIDLGIFSQRFCLMKAAFNTICKLPEYDYFCRLHNHITPTGKLRRSADSVAKFVARDAHNSLENEPHTALEDARDYEALILHEILKTHTRKQLLEAGK